MRWHRLTQREADQLWARTRGDWSNHDCEIDHDSADQLMHPCADKWAVSLAIPTLLVVVCGVCVWALRMTFISLRTRMDKLWPDTIMLLVCAWMLLLLVPGANGAKQRQWNLVGNPAINGKPSGRSGHTMVTGPDGSIYMFGGHNSEYFLDELFKLDVHTGEWHAIEPLGSIRASSRVGHAMTVCGNDIYLFGGVTSNLMSRWQEGERKRERQGRDGGGGSCYMSYGILYNASDCLATV